MGGVMVSFERASILQKSGKENYLIQVANGMLNGDPTAMDIKYIIFAAGSRSNEPSGKQRFFLQIIS